MPPSTTAPIAGAKPFAFRLDDRLALEFETVEGVFVPTATSQSLIRAFDRLSPQPGRLLDLGCGCGIVGVVAQKLGWAKPPFCASDLSVEAVECTKVNAEKHNCEVDARAGSLFAPWAGEKFDWILDDVSGIAEEVARISPWFAGVPCHSGGDGTELVCDVLRSAPTYLNDGGTILFPAISLSACGKIVAAAKECFGHVERLSRDEWPLPPSMAPHISELRKLRDEGKIDFTEKFGMIILYTEIYAAR